MNHPKTIIDSDIHNAIRSKDVLLPYLDKYWKYRLETSGLPRSGTVYSSPVGVSRADAKPPGGGPACSDPAYTIEHHLDPSGIAVAILNTSGLLGLSLSPEPDFANAVATAYNRHVADVWLSHSDRYRGSIVINHSDPPAAAQEIRRCAEDKRFVQVLMASGSTMLFGHRNYHPIYEAAEECGLPVAFHPGTESAGISGPPTPSGYPSRYMEWHNILPTNYMAHINSIICEGIFERFPKLRIVAVEGGLAWVPHLMWRMDKNWKALHSSAPWLKKAPSEYLVEHVRLTTQPIEEPEDPAHLVAILEMMQAEKTVMFSSDYPHWDGDNPKFSLPRLPDEMVERIYYKNAAELYGIEIPETAATPVA